MVKSKFGVDNQKQFEFSSRFAWFTSRPVSPICGGLVKTTCRGDSGGPVVANINGQFTVIGLTSFGLKDSCGTNVPGVYADVSYPDNLKFIHSVN